MDYTYQTGSGNNLQEHSEVFEVQIYSDDVVVFPEEGKPLEDAPGLIRI